MGAIKRDMTKNSRMYDESYPYESRGIKSLLRDIYRMSESRYLNGDIDATVILADLKLALDSGCLTPRMRQVIALYYFLGFTQSEISEISGVTQPTIVESLDEALLRVSAEMCYGYKQGNGAKANAKLTPTNEIERDLFIILNDITEGIRPVYVADACIFTASIRYLANKGNKKALEVVRQQIEGSVIVDDIQPLEGEYTALTWEQMRWDDRRISYVPDIYYDDRYVKTGFRNVPEVLEDENGGEWRYHRIRIFSKRN